MTATSGAQAISTRPEFSGFSSRRWPQVCRRIWALSVDSPFPRSESRYGGEALAVQIPSGGTWMTTREGALIAVKLFWWSAGFQPGMESKPEIDIRSLIEQPMTARVSRPTNAHSESLGGWTMLSGIDFPDAGCWETSGHHLGQTLAFVVETIADSRKAED